MPTVRYPACVTREGDTYGVVFPDFPGCVAAAGSANEVLAQATEALAFHIEGMIDHGDDIPEPRDIDAERPDWVDEPDFVSLVPVDLPGKSVRVQITLDEGLLGRLDRAARDRGMTRSGLLAEGARAVIGAR